MRDTTRTVSLSGSRRTLLAIVFLSVLPSPLSPPRRKTIVAFFVCLAVATFAATAKDDLDQGLKVGQTIPLNMSVPDQNGETRSLKALTGRSGLILLFTRSLDW